MSSDMGSVHDIKIETRQKTASHQSCPQFIDAHIFTSLSFRFETTLLLH